MDASTMPLFEEEPMAHSDGGPRGVLELARSATPVARRRGAALGLARSLARQLAGRRALPSARVGVSATAWQVTVVEERGVGAAGVLVRRVETALAVPNREPPPPASWGARRPVGVAWRVGPRRLSRVGAGRGPACCLPGDIAAG